VFLRDLFSSLSLSLPATCRGKATTDDEGDTSEDEQAVLDLEDEGVGDVQGPIILSEEEDSEFDEDVAPVFKRRRVQRVGEAKRKIGSSSAPRGKSLHQDSSPAE
jgi:hypothetical protein